MSAKAKDAITFLILISIPSIIIFTLSYFIGHKHGYEKGISQSAIREYYDCYPLELGKICKPRNQPLK